MNCDHCEFRAGCNIRNAHEDGTAAFSCGMDFGIGNAKTVVHRGRYSNGKYVWKFERPNDDPHLLSWRAWFTDDFLNKMAEVYASHHVKKAEAEIYSWIKSNPICYTNPCEDLLEGFCGCIVPSPFPQKYEQYNVSEYFLQFPLGLPIELKGITE